MAATSAFSTRPYAAGSLVGQRAFGLTSRQRLRGPRFPQPVGAGVNHARCLTPFMSEVLFALETPSLWATMTPADVNQECTCGFYAYTDPKGREFESPHRFNGIIEGFGNCVIGPLGFRCSKMRILALVQPHLRGDDDPMRDLWGDKGPKILPSVGRLVARNYGIPLFDTYEQAYREFPLTRYESV